MLTWLKTAEYEDKLCKLTQNSSIDINDPGTRTNFGDYYILKQKQPNNKQNLKISKDKIVQQLMPFWVG